MTLGQIGGVGGQFVCDHADFHIVAVGQAKVLFGRDVAKHCCAVPTDLCRADARGDVVIPRRDVRDQWPECVERCFAAHLKLLFHILFDLVHRHVARPFDHDLHVLFPRAVGELAKGVEFGELRFVVGIRNAAGAQAIAE